MQKSIVLICLLSIGVFWSWSEAEAVTYSATVKIACPTLIAVGDSKELTVTASGANEPEYDTEEFVLHEGQWSISVSPSLTLIPPADLDGESGSATYHLSSGVAQKVTYTATATKTYTFSRKEGVSTDIELPESVTYSGSDTKDVIFVAIAGMQYKIGSMEWTDANEVIKVPKGSSVSFRVLRAPDPKDTSEWPSG